mmetsp:Transcript_30553/g.78481  ORF Transcript_30553/g.78481 Transcript_30553/m.78481 type:complete len:246 (-) Transcript_30553:401-1138(-)
MIDPSFRSYMLLLQFQKMSPASESPKGAPMRSLAGVDHSSPTMREPAGRSRGGILLAPDAGRECAPLARKLGGYGAAGYLQLGEQRQRKEQLAKLRLQHLSAAGEVEGAQVAESLQRLESGAGQTVAATEVQHAQGASQVRCRGLQALRRCARGAVREAERRQAAHGRKRGGEARGREGGAAREVEAGQRRPRERGEPVVRERSAAAKVRPPQSSHCAPAGEPRPPDTAALRQAQLLQLSQAAQA